MLVSPEDPIQSLPKLRYRSSKTAGILRGGYRMSDFKVCLFLCVFFFVRSGATLVQWTVHSSDGPVSNQPWAEFVHNHMVKGQPKVQGQGRFFYIMRNLVIWCYPRGFRPTVIPWVLWSLSRQPHLLPRQFQAGSTWIPREMKEISDLIKLTPKTFCNLWLSV